jgi:hypothetical protein
VELLRIDLTGAPVRVTFDDGTGSTPGVLGVDVTDRIIEGAPHTVVQFLVDDDAPGFDPDLLDGPVVVDLVDGDAAVLARELLDHDRFRRQLRAERDLGRSTLRGVLVLTDGSLPPPWVRLAFLPVELASTGGAQLVLRRSTVPDLLAGVDAAHAAGELTDDERRTAITSIEQRHPEFN